MTATQAEQIVVRARAAQQGWAALSPAQRSRPLHRLRRVLAEQCEPIADLIAHEVRKPQLDALAGDVMVTLEMLRYTEKHCARVLRSRKAKKPAFFFQGARFHTSFEPHGVVLVFGPSNYPLQLSMVPAITALAAGNAVVLKCSERTPATAERMAALFQQAGFDAGLVQVVSHGPEESAALVDARPDMIFFTGSSRNGKLIAERAAHLLIPAVLELGGKDAALVFADCHVERAVEGLVYSAFSNTGRVCVGTRRVFIQSTLYQDFLARLAARMGQLRVGSGADVDLCSPSPEETQALSALVDDALARGATLRFPTDRSSLGNGPVLLTDVPSDARVLAEECFGPVLCASAFTGEDEALKLANNSPFALSSSVWTRDRQRGQRVARQISAGSCAVNDVIRVIANPHAPFGGNRSSGYGRYHGEEGLRTFSRTRTILVANDRRLREINWFPFSERTRRQLAVLLRFRHAPGALLSLLSRFLPLFLLSVAFTCGGYAQSAHLAVNVNLIPIAQGELAYLVFNAPAGFPGDPAKALRHGFIPIPAGARQMHLDLDLPPGTYAISLYEDLNGNHKLDHNFIGIPTEPVGASNNPPGRMGPPLFKDCSFQVESGSQTISISMARGR